MTGWDEQLHHVVARCGRWMQVLSEAYTREEFEVDRAGLLAMIAAKHDIAESEVDALIREHRYEHSGEDLEDEYIGIMAMARAAGWLP